MSQDTRKDKRAKVVSLNVRYKSATVDEFIENHSHDVSKGGIFVKTPTPFPPGTLLKFEIRLAGDKSVISGVGRVVWKREPTQAGAERPAGMGVKFIKIDDQSRALIDKLTAEKPNAGSAYTSEVPGGGGDEEHGDGHPSTLRGIPAAAPISTETTAIGSHPVSVPPPKPSGAALPTPGKLPPPAKPPVITGAPTATGLPSLTAPPKPVVTSPAGTQTLKGPPPPAVTARATPAVTAAAIAASTAPSDKVVTAAPSSNKAVPPAASSSEKQVAKALDRIAPSGDAPSAPGSDRSDSKPNAPPRPQIPPPRKATMMGIGLPSVPPGAASGSEPPKEATPPPPKAAEPMFPRLDPESGREEVREPTVMKQAAELLEEALKEAGGSLDEIGANPLFAKQGGVSSGLTPEPGPPPSSDGMGGQSGKTVIMTGATPSPAGVSPSAPPPSVSPSAPPPSVAPGLAPMRASSPSYTGPTSVPPASAAQPIGGQLDQPKKGGGAGIAIGLVAVLLLAGGGVYAWKSGILGGGTPTPTATTPPPPPSSTPTPTASTSATPTTAVDSGTTAASTADSGAAATAVDAGATTEKDAGKPAASAEPKPKPKPVWKPPVKPPVNPPDNPDTPTEPTAKDPAPTDVPKEAPKETPPADPN